MQLQDAQDRSDAAEAAQAYPQSILDTGREPFLVLDATLHVVTANRAFLQTFRVTPAETVGRFLYDLGDGQWDIPALRGLLEDVLPSDSQFADFEVSHDFPRVGPKTVLLNGRKLYRPGNHTEMVLLAIEDVSRRRHDEVRQRESDERFQLLVEGARDYAMMLLDREGRVTAWNTGAQRILGYDEAEIIGQPAAVIFTPEDRAGGVPEREMARAASEGRAVDIRWHRRKDGSRFWADGVLEGLRDESGRVRGFAKILRDATERRALEEALEAERVRLRTTLQQMPSGVAIAEAPDGRIVFQNEAGVRLLGHPFLDFGAVSGYARFGAVHADGSPYDAAEYPLARAVLSGETVTGEEMLYRRGDDTRTTLSVSTAPLRDAAGAVTGAVATFHDISAQKQAEQEMRARAEREALINRIGRAIRASSDPDAIQAAAVRELGAGMGADRAFFALYDVGRDRAWVERDYRRAGLPPLTGDYRLSDLFGADDYSHQSTRLISGVHAEPSPGAAPDGWERFGLRAVLSVPLYESGRLVGSLCLGMADAPRVWTAEEAALVERVAQATRVAAESARLSLREHTIATQLERALQPDIPRDVPGLRLAKYYEAALDEAGVGGDFYDVFASEKGLTFLVVGDLSGKGLDAAAQVATVRNMLRFALYNGRTVAGPVAGLNRTLAENGLLTGFATLFVGRYDAGAGVLTYVNCGQEPGLLRRASSGQVVELAPTGPVLGTFPEAAFHEESVRLAPGDAVALFTDGLTEAGPDRSDMLGLGGIAALLGEPPGEAGADAAEAAERLALRLIAGVDAYAQAGVRDDVCLLVAVAA